MARAIRFISEGEQQAFRQEAFSESASTLLGCFLDVATVRRGEKRGEGSDGGRLAEQAEGGGGFDLQLSGRGAQERSTCKPAQQAPPSSKT